jgi:hypothetical protein
MKIFTKITFVLLCLLAYQAAHSQNAHWALFPLQKYNPVANTRSTLPGLFPTQCTNSNNPAATNGVFDANGNPLFYVAGKDIYNRAGQIVHTIDAPTCPAEINICPVPGGLCGDYYIIYATIGKASDPAYNGYEIVAQKISTDVIQNITVGNASRIAIGTNAGIYPSRGIATALSKENNGQRKYYLTLRAATHQITRVKLDANGLSLDGGFASLSNGYIESHSMEISPDQRYLAWMEGSTRVIVRDLIANAPLVEINVNGIDSGSDIEFGVNSNDIYVTSRRGLIKTTVANPASFSYVPNSWGIDSQGRYFSNFYGADMELANDGNLYLASHDNNLTKYTPSNNSLTPMLSYQGLGLPEQIDGETIGVFSGGQNLPAITVNISIGLNATLIAQVSGGSGNYSYTWNTPSSPNYGTSAILNACGNVTHQLVVRDNSTGCSVTTSFYYASGKYCEAVIDPIRRRVSPQTTGKVQLLPNPASEQVKVQVGSGEKIVQLQIISLQGKTVAQHKGNAANNQIVSLKGLKPGVYVLTVTTNKSSSQQKLVVK